MRRAALTKLTETTPDGYATALTGALTDAHANVRRTAVQSMAPLAADPAVAEALTGSLDDTDADVRAYARRALAAAARGE